MIAEARFRRLDAPVLLAEVAERAVYDDGERFEESDRGGYRLTLFTRVVG